MKKIFQNKFIQVFFVSFVIFVFSYGILKIVFYNINGEFLYFVKKILTEKVNSNIVVVEIDDLTYNKLWFPLDRWDYIPFLDNLKKANAAVIGFDILFLDKWKDPKKDTLLANKFRELWNIIIGADTSRLIKIKEKNYLTLVKPYDLFNKSVQNIWYFQPTINPETNKVYSLKPYNELNYNGKTSYFESFSFAILRSYFNFIYHKKETNILWNNWKNIYKFFNKNIPTKWWEFFISFAEWNKFNNNNRESFYNIYTGNFNKDILKDKIILVWYTAEWVKDDFLLPWIWKWWTTKWVYVHANTINNVLNDNYVIFFNEKIEKWIWFIFIIFIVYLNIFYLKHLNLRWISFWGIIIFLVVLFFYIVSFFVLYKQSGIYLLPNYPFEFISVLFLSFFVSSILKYVNEDKNKKLLFTALSDYVSSDIANEILNGTWNINLDGEKKRITIFFSDIAWFTTISEKLSPEELVWFLKIYLWNMSDIIKANKWTIDKYEWDAIMAWWWVFGKTEKYWIIDACNSCLLQQMELKRLNEIWKKEWKNELSVRMGLNTWDAIVGNIWSKWKKMEYTALWDSVNLASRLEWVNKFYGTYICVSEDVYNEAKEKFTFRYLDKIRVKWKNIWVNIYELISYIWEEWDFKKDIISRFSTAIGFYFEKNFNEAFNIFSALAELWDNPSKTYKSRCERYLVNPPHEDWDGVWVLDEK